MDVKDIGKKIENENLVKAMKEVRANENSATLRTLFESVVHAVFVVPAKFDEEPKPDENGKVTFQNGVKINFSLLTNEQETRYSHVSLIMSLWMLHSLLRDFRELYCHTSSLKTLYIIQMDR